MAQRTRVEGPAGRVYPVAGEGPATPRFAEGAPQIFTRLIDLSVARQNERFSATGTILWAISASSLDAALTINFNDQRGQGIAFQQGMMLRGLKFDQLFLTNIAQAGQTITLFYSVETDTTLQIENPLIAFQNVTLDQPDNLASTADVSIPTAATAVVIAARAARHISILSNLNANPREFRVGDASVTATRGIELLPGQSIEILGTAEISAFNPHTAAQSIAVIEVYD